MTAGRGPGAPTHRSPVVVVGIGNPMRGDDGIGPAAVEALGDRARPPTVVGDGGAPPSFDRVVTSGEVCRLLEEWAGRDLAVVVDAVTAGAPPGTVHRAELRSGRLQLTPPRPAAPPGGGVAGGLAPRTVGGGHAGSSHAAGLAEALALAGALDRLPRRLVVLGVEPARLDTGAGLSPAVAAALPDLVRLLVAELAPQPVGPEDFGIGRSGGGD